MATFQIRAMNTSILTAGLSAEDAAQVFQWFRFIEAKFSRFLPASELSLVNGKAGEATKVSELFAHLVYESLHYFEETGGIFTPFLGKTLSGSGYGQSFEKVERENARTDDPVDNPTGFVEPIRFNLDLRTVNINDECLFDFGGIAKGWSAEQMAASLMKKGRKEGLIDAGGDIMSWKSGSSGEPWLIGIAHPYSDDKTIARLQLKEQAGVATSSVIKRSWKLDGRKMHHIIDPRTGLPAESDLVQATVIGRTLVPCEIYAKCLLILGSEQGPSWLRLRQPELAYILVDQQGRLSASLNIDQYLDEADLSKQITLDGS
ncbi:FAD:protein FMN transferase [Paenibacillus caui]|uniref:FAD:protein FMN transferase n=1 Tax=Paenibacillus caui TaxID=2873927 RepID=UPI001CA81535|nr:FAD:protein FMN transferase [Paenibacillus caui]